jgi:hypothetical protein
MKDDHNLTGRRVRANLILRGGTSPDGSKKLVAPFGGFILDLPVEELMAASGGKDIHLVAELTLDRVGSVTADHTWRQGPEDLLEALPAFSSHGKS